MVILFSCILLIVIAYIVYSKFSKLAVDDSLSNKENEESTIENSLSVAKTHLENVYKEALFQAITIKENTPCVMLIYNKDISQFKELLPDELMVTFLKDVGEIVEENEVFAVVNIDDSLFQITASCRGYLYWEEESKKVLFVTNGTPICMIMNN